MSGSGREKALDLLQVSRETAQRLEIFEDLLRRWQVAINLISTATIEDIWLRHIADSGQLLRLAPATAEVWADIGAGAGFPGGIIGILLTGRPGVQIHLIESDQRKAAFLRAVSRETGAPLVIHCKRAEAALPVLPRLDVVTSRATASLARLLAWSEPALKTGAVGLFLKGERVQEELTAAKPLTSIHLSLAPSLTHSSAAIVVARAVRPETVS